MIDAIARLPEISFIDTSLDEIEARLVKDYEEKYAEVTGNSISLKSGEPMQLALYACAVQFLMMYEDVDKAGKMNFYKYSFGDYLDNLVAFKSVERQQASPAVCTVRFTLSAIRASVISIPQGTRITTQGAGIYFATDEYAEIPIGDEYVDVMCTAMTDGEVGNGLAVGSLSVIVDPVAYVASCTNISETSGGLDKETDESLKDRAYLVPANYSVAGPEAAYRYHVMTAYPGVADVKITSPDACEVDIRVIGPNGTLLSEDVCQTIEDYLMDAQVRPQTDLVTVSSPELTTYDIDITYYINRSDVYYAATIQEAVQKAVAEYIVWQSEKIGRDIEPGKLVELCMAAGAKRVVVTSPEFDVVSDIAIPVLGSETITYGGLEND